LPNYFCKGEQRGGKKKKRGEKESAMHSHPYSFLFLYTKLIYGEKERKVWGERKEKKRGPTDH